MKKNESDTLTLRVLIGCLGVMLVLIILTMLEYVRLMCI